MFSTVIINKLQTARRKKFATYDEIFLSADAVPIFARLFINPDCQTDIDLASLKGHEVQLSFLGDHIITAAPSTLAAYAERHKKTILSAEDLLHCFALEHAHDVAHNHIAERTSPAYALAHILQLSRVASLSSTDDGTTASLSLPTLWGSILFRHVLVPRDLTVTRRMWVYHHFGVIVAAATDQQFASRIVELQKTDDFIASLGRTVRRKRIVVDFGDASLFGKDVLGMILRPSRNPIITNPGDLMNGKIAFKH
ncbi:MAG: hypothetical protein A3B30_01750 [Candidatus Komeilibacteria bacterium RIFCSPLOWO2_01_FULL_52_15]|uniref:Uncharacterized protein n=2 Tax=Candidatus Komeiliibacteriota TaxID=1817908 RepID=A0A1G2BUQ6_9BACT|nr:MAG: hypothetical protein A2677_03240 [Candidatus Komeilibacteria bacterium RIFCSPHIGHO2_01_FULL_52_14]OGY91947.1 MAG: hypothetical protein A3B30_01750 [Candidatus Komeilibacteria bacterium RIFCSPLOWO2_01_FULL_52_15]